MKNRRYLPLLILLGILVTPCPVFAQDASAEESVSGAAPAGDTGFGLQADIFRQVRGINTDFTKNFSSMVDYTLTPGDIFTLVVTSGVRSDGSISNDQTYTVQLQKDFTLNIPFLGSISADGRTLTELQEYVIRRVRNTLPVQYVNFILTTPAQFNIFIYGGVVQPGYIVANPLMGVIEAIATAGGFKPNASYRQVRLIRNGGTPEDGEGDSEGETLIVDISRFYEMADFSSNPRLQPGDKVYVPPAEIVTSVTGNVNFPGVYELVGDETLATLLNLAGGVKPDTLTSKIGILRIGPNGRHETITIPVKFADQLPMKNGDRVSVRSTSESTDMITVQGAVFGRSFDKQNIIQVPREPVRTDLPYTPGITLLTALDMVGGPTPLIDTDEESLILRKTEQGTEERIEIDIKKLWETRDEKYDVDLLPGDFILVPMKTLKVFVTGAVSNPGAYTFMKGNTVNDYLLLAGGIEENVGDPNGLWFMDEEGNRTEVELTTVVEPETNIYVSKTVLKRSDQFVQNLLITTGWITAIIGVINIVWDFVERF